mgnify:CR=1 FL=1|jgi:F420-dependent methylenetetrahydromethanopterin dehydrogenase
MSDPKPFGNCPQCQRLNIKVSAARTELIHAARLAERARELTQKHKDAIAKARENIDGARESMEWHITEAHVAVTP